jgi:hypothetical protein
MQKLIIISILFLSTKTNAQIGIGIKNPHPSSALEVHSSNKGILLPRMTNAEKLSISNPANGLIIFQIDSIRGVYYYDSLDKKWQIQTPMVQSTLQNKPKIGQLLYYNGSFFDTIQNGLSGSQLYFCHGKPQWGPCLPFVDSVNASNSGTDSILITSKILNIGSSSVTSQGFKIKLKNRFNSIIYDDSIINTDINSGFYLADIESNGKYYFTAYATNQYGMSFSNTTYFQAPQGRPKIKLDSAFSFHLDSFKLLAQILDSSGFNIIQRGFCYSFSSTNPDTSATVIITNNNLNILKINGFTSTRNSTCYVRAFARNSKGIQYSNALNFLTYKSPNTQYCTGRSGGNINSNLNSTNGYIEMKIKDTLNLNTTGSSMNWFCSRSGWTFDNSSKVQTLSNLCSQNSYPPNMSTSVKFTSTGVFTVTATTTDGVTTRTCVTDILVNP